MEKTNKLILVGIITLIVGLGVGYCAAANGPYDRGNYARQQRIPTGMHMMANGQMMGNNGAYVAPDADDAYGNQGMMNSSTTGMMNMQGMMASMNAGLIGKTGDAFDATFLSEMIVHHQGAVAMAELALKNAKHQEIKDLATGIISAQNKEIAEMQAWEKSWYNK